MERRATRARGGWVVAWWRRGWSVVGGERAGGRQRVAESGRVLGVGKGEGEGVGRCFL